MINVNNVSIERGPRTVISNVTLEVPTGQCVALVGPNGSGKSTLLGGITGDLDVSAGSIAVDNSLLTELDNLDLAKLRAVMTQQVSVSFGFVVREVVKMGRSPWRGTDASNQDDAVVNQCLVDMDIEHLADRPVQALSGGELARVAMARVLAQSTPILILDEPTAALDLRHQQELLECVKRHTDDGGAALIVLHDLSLTAAYADQVGVLSEGNLVAMGTPQEVLVPDVLNEVYETEVITMTHPRTGRPIIIPG